MNHLGKLEDYLTTYNIVKTDKDNTNIINETILKHKKKNRYIKLLCENNNVLQKYTVYPKLVTDTVYTTTKQGLHLNDFLTHYLFLFTKTELNILNTLYTYREDSNNSFDGCVYMSTILSAAKITDVKSLKVHVHNIRKKITKNKIKVFNIIVKRGVGYSLELF